MSRIEHYTYDGLGITLLKKHVSQNLRQLKSETKFKTGQRRVRKYARVNLFVYMRALS